MEKKSRCSNGNGSWASEDRQRAKDAFLQCGTVSGASKATGIPRATITGWRKRGKWQKELKPPPPPAPDGAKKLLDLINKAETPTDFEETKMELARYGMVQFVLNLPRVKWSIGDLKLLADMFRESLIAMKPKDAADHYTTATLVSTMADVIEKHSIPGQAPVWLSQAREWAESRDKAGEA
jgi:hypothetical protein